MAGAEGGEVLVPKIPSYRITDVAEAIASGRFDLDRKSKTTAQVAAALGDWSPVVRSWAAEELAKEGISAEVIDPRTTWPLDKPALINRLVVMPGERAMVIVDFSSLPAGATEATVRNQYIRPGQPPVPVEYAMRKTPEGWKIYDITVENVRLHGEGQREFIRLKPVVNQYMRTKAPGHIRGVAFKNVAVAGTLRRERGTSGPFLLSARGDLFLQDFVVSTPGAGLTDITRQVARLAAADGQGFVCTPPLRPEATRASQRPPSTIRPSPREPRSRSRAITAATPNTAPSGGISPAGSATASDRSAFS